MVAQVMTICCCDIRHERSNLTLIEHDSSTFVFRSGANDYLSAEKLPSGASGCLSDMLGGNERGTPEDWRVTPAKVRALGGLATLLPIIDPKPSAELPLPENSGVPALVETCKQADAHWQILNATQAVASNEMQCTIAKSLPQQYDACSWCVMIS